MSNAIQIARQLHQKGRQRLAEQHCLTILKRNPQNVQAWCLLAAVYHAKGQLRLATASLQKAVDIGPSNASMLASLGGFLRLNGRYIEARNKLEMALQLNPNNADALNNLAVVLKSFGQLEKSLTHLKRAMEICPTSKIWHSNYLFTITAAHTLSPADTLNAYRAWDKQHGQVHQLPQRPSVAKARLRIGYVSCDLYAHPVTRFFAPVLREHDPQRVDVFVYADVANPDSVTQDLKDISPHWRNIRGMTDAAAAALIYEDDIDILIDLSGHTAYNRLGVFAHKPAPIQATYLGYFGPTGLDSVDYWITDSVLHPMHTEEETQEKIHRLPRCWVAYEAPPEAPEPNRRRTDRPVTFASFNDSTKISTDVVAVWAEILHNVPESTLRLQAKQFDTPEIRQYFQRQLQSFDVSAERVQFFGHTTLSEYYGAYHDVDVVLDSFPRTGGTTVADALWMGVPVVGLTGNRYASRIAASKLTALGHGEWATSTISEYVEMAVRLGGDPRYRAELRQHLRSRMRSSALCDGGGLARALENAYFEMQEKAKTEPKKNRP